MEIVVSGLGIVSALGIGIESNIKALQDGRSGITPQAKHLQTSHILPVGEVDYSNVELHNLAKIGEKEHLSRTALLGILAVREALSDAKISKTKRIGLVSATSVAGMDLTEHFFAVFIKDETKGRLRDVRMHDCGATTEAIVKHCNINGYYTALSTACSSAANAIIVGAKLLRHNIVDAVVVGGCDALSLFTINGFKSLMILDENRCRPFDSTRCGLNLGEGAGYLVLQPQSESEKEYCKLLGGANSNDANHQTASSIEGDGAYLAMYEALMSSGRSPEQVSYINTHGTGTVNNDLSEGNALMRLFGETIPPFSSTKAFTGHTLAAAGGIEAVLSAVAIKKGYLYPNLGFNNIIDEFGATPQTHFINSAKVDCVVTNSFGFGGNCSSLIFGK